MHQRITIPLLSGRQHKPYAVLLQNSVGRQDSSGVLELLPSAVTGPVARGSALPSLGEETQAGSSLTRDTGHV